MTMFLKLSGYVAEFYIGFFHKYYYYSKFDPSVVLMTTEKKPVFYSIEATGVGYSKFGIITVDHEAILHLPYSVVVSSLYDNNKGIHIKTSSSRVTVHGQAFVESYTYDYWGNTSKHLEIFVAIPVTDLCAMEYEYYAVSVSGYSSYYNSSILVVGTEDNTTMKLIVTRSLAISINYGLISLRRGQEYTFVINRLQTIYIGSPEDLTGSKIVTDKQVSVFSGHQFSDITNASSSSISSQSSYLIEQIPPTVLWGKVHYIMPLSQQDSDDYFIKIVASKFCVINIYRNPTSMHIFSGALYEGQFLFKAFPNNESYTILSTGEVLIMQFSLGLHDSNGMMITVPSIKQYYSNFIFSTIQSINKSASIYQYEWYHSINIIVRAQFFNPAMIYLVSNGHNRSLDTQKWLPIKINNIIEVYTTQVNIPHGISRIFHTDDTAMMIVLLYGLSSYGSYGTAISNNINKGIVYVLSF